MAAFKRGGIWWYKFYFAGQEIRESSKSTSKTVAKTAEQQRRRELEAGFHNLKEVRQPRIRYIKDIISEYLVGYRLRYTFAGSGDRRGSTGMSGRKQSFELNDLLNHILEAIHRTRRLHGQSNLCRVLPEHA
jgi:hypothetical protein